MATAKESLKPFEKRRSRAQKATRTAAHRSGRESTGRGAGRSFKRQRGTPPARAGRFYRNARRLQAMAAPTAA